MSFLVILRPKTTILALPAMNNTTIKALSTLAAATLFALATWFTQAKPKSDDLEITYSTIGHGPSILLLHDSSDADLDWANAARDLANSFEVTLVDISNYLNIRESAQKLRQALQDLDIDDSRITGSSQAEQLAIDYSQSFPTQSNSFILPHDSKDLQNLAVIFNSTLCNKS